MKSSLQPGMTLQGRYKILDRIGSGGMGHVFKAHALRLNIDCALKEMQEHFVDPEERAKIAAQFNNEAKTLAKLDHPGIPHILDTFEENDKHYLVMEFVDGQTLEDYIMNADDNIPQSQLLGWLWQLIDILEYLHTLPEPVIIRDLKPANIMITEDGKIKIIDFGIAKIFETSSSQTMTRIKGSGSAGFAPPEQYGSQGTDNRSDIYALGVTIYYLLTKITLPDSVDRILSGGNIEPMKNYNSTVTAPMEKMVTKMVMLKPEDRFQSADQIRNFMEENNLKGEFMPVTIKKIHTILPNPVQREEKEKEVNKWKEEYETSNSQTIKTRKSDAEENIKEEKSIFNRRQDAPVIESPKTDTSVNLSENDTANPLIDPNLLKARARYMSEAMRPKMPAPETAKPASSSPVMVIILVIALMALVAGGGFFVYRFLKITAPPPEPAKTSEPTPTVTEPPKPYTEKIVDGDVSKIEIGDKDVKLRVDTADEGYLNFIISKTNFPKNVKAKAEVQITYKVPKETQKARQPWEILNITVIKEAPAEIAPPPIDKTPKPAPTQTYTPQPARTYTPQPVYTAPPKQDPRPAYTPPPKNNNDDTSSGGSFKQPKTNY